MKIKPVLITIATAIPFAVSLFCPNGTLTCILRIVLFCIFVGLNYITNVSSNSTIIIERSKNKLANQMLTGAKEIAEYRQNDIKKSFAKVINGEVYEKLNYDPKKKIYFILEQLRINFKNYIVIEDENISTAIFYHFDFQEERNWTRLGQNYFNAYENDESVIFDSNSFGKHVLKSKKSFHFLNDKLQEGTKEGIYKLNDKDVEIEKECHKYGSIIGFKFGVKENEIEHISVLLTISTYGKRIDNVPFKAFRKQIESEIRDDILPMYQKEIESELMQLYLQEGGYLKDCVNLQTDV